MTRAISLVSFSPHQERRFDGFLANASRKFAQGTRSLSHYVAGPRITDVVTPCDTDILGDG